MTKVVRLNEETAALLDLVRQRDNQVLSLKGMKHLRDMKSDSDLIREGLEGIFSDRVKLAKELQSQRAK